MDSVFQLSNGDRANFLRSLMQSLGCSYICLWNFSPDQNILFCAEGYYQEETPSHPVGATSSSSASITRALFEEYKRSRITISEDEQINRRVPGVAFKHRIPYLELHELDLQSHISNTQQLEFYLEARIKIAGFWGFEGGEIEVGMSHIPQISLEMKMQDFARQHQSSLAPMEVPRITDQNRPSPSSSFSMDSPELLYNIPSSSTYLQDHLHNLPFPTPESTDAALTRAYLAILSSTSSSPTSQSTKVQQRSTSPYGYPMNQRPSAFRRYGGGLRPSVSEMRSNLRRQTMLKRAIAYFRGLNYRRFQEQANFQGSARPTSTQLHHMISERKRREKINESFQALRSLLPQGTKKDKASVLKTTREYLSSLQAQVEELKRRNQLLKSNLPSRETTPLQVGHLPANEERINVTIMPVSESTSSGERMVDLQLRLTGDQPITDLIIRVLDFLKQAREASMVSMEAQSLHQQVEVNQIPAHRMTFRLRIEVQDWDESIFIEAVRRILSEFAQ